MPDSSELESPITLDMLSDFSVIIISGYMYPEKISRWYETHYRLNEVIYSADGAGLVPFRMLEFGRAEVDQTLKELGQPFRDGLFMKYTGHPEAYFSGQPIDVASAN